MTKYLFVKSFDWINTALQETFNGHLRPNTVYKSKYYEDSRLYHVEIDKMPDGEPINLVLPGLIVKEDPHYGYSYELEELTPENILDFDLSEEQLDEIIKSMRPKSANTPNPIETGLQKLGASIREQRQQEEAEFCAKAIDKLGYLFDINSTRAWVLLEALDSIIEETETEIDDPAYNLTNSKDHSTGIHIARVLRNLDDYTCQNKRINLNPNHLLDSINALVREYENNILTKE